jgi:hypothetical protein
MYKMIIDASSCFAAKTIASELQRNVGEDWVVQVEYSSDADNPYDWYDIEFSLIEKKTGMKHEVPPSALGIECNDNVCEC